MPALPSSAVSAAAVSDAAAVKAAVVGTRRAARQKRHSPEQAGLGKVCQSVKANRAMSPVASGPADGPLWMNRRSKFRKIAKAKVATAGAADGRDVQHRAGRRASLSKASCARRIPLAANNSATSKAQQPPQEVAAAADAPSPATAVTAVTDDSDVSSEAANESPVAENAAMIRVNSLSRLLRQKLSGRRKRLQLAKVEANMNLVKLGQHPAQLMREIQRLENSGTSRMRQLKLLKQQSEYLEKAKSVNKKRKKPDEDEQSVLFTSDDDFPDWIPFKLRFRRHNAKEIWNEFVVHRRDMSKELGDRALSTIKLTDRYNESYIDLWTRSISIQARPIGLLRDLVRPVFARLGIDSKADLHVTIGCFAGDTRQGGTRVRGMPKTPVNVSMQTSVIRLYQTGISELFVSSWPGFRTGFPKGFIESLSMPAKKTEGECEAEDAQNANVSNTNLSLINRFLRDSELAAARHYKMHKSGDRVLPNLVQSCGAML